MHKVDETQRLLEELAAMSLCSPADVKAWIKGTTAIAMKLGQQVALLRGLVHDAENEEPDGLVRGKMEGIIQQVDAETRIIGNISKEARSLSVSLRILEEQVGEFRALAKDAGYDAD